MGTLQNGTYRLMTSNRPVKRVEDFQGLKIRTMNDPIRSLPWRLWGAAVTPYVLLRGFHFPADQGH